MRNLEKILALIALTTMTVTLVRHVYVRWLNPMESVLDRYEQPLKNEIAKARSLEELLQRYDPVRRETDRLRREEPLPEKETYLEYQKEPFISERLLREAIHDWESKSKEVHALRFYWLVGLAISLGGWGLYSKGIRWFGLSLLITGFSEISYWTTPTFFGGTQEFERLLNNKILLSAFSLVILVCAIHFCRIFTEGKDNHADLAS